MLSLLTYGATFGVAERASTRHEIDLAQEFVQSSISRSNAIDSGQNSGQDSAVPSETIHSETIYSQTEQEQRIPKGGVFSWLKRLIDRPT